MGTRSKKASRRTRQARLTQKSLADLPTLHEIEQLKYRVADQQASNVSLLSPDYREAQMAFDQAVFLALPRVTLVRHPYKDEIPPERIDQRQHSQDIAAGRILLMSIICPSPEDIGFRHKEIRAMGPDNFLYQPLSKGQCALLGENPDGALVYGLLRQQLPLELLQSGITPY